MQGHVGKHQVSREAEGAREECAQESLMWFSWEGTGEAGFAGLGWTSSGHFSGSGSTGSVPSCLGRLGVYEQVKEVGVGVGV